MGFPKTSKASFGGSEQAPALQINVRSIFGRGGACSSRVKTMLLSFGTRLLRNLPHPVSLRSTTFPSGEGKTTWRNFPKTERGFQRGKRLKICDGKFSSVVPLACFLCERFFARAKKCGKTCTIKKRNKNHITVKHEKNASLNPR